MSPTDIFIQSLENGTDPSLSSLGSDFGNSLGGLGAAATVTSLNDVATQAYNAMKLQLYDIPMAADAKERTALQAASDAVDAAQKQAQETGYYQPVTGFNYDATNNTMTPVFGGTATPTAALQEASGFLDQNGGTTIGAGNGNVPTEQEQALQMNTGLGLLDLLGKLQSSPFQQEAVARGANASGIANSIGSLTGLIPALPSFQANQATPTSPSLSQLFAPAAGSTPTAASSGAPGSTAGAASTATTVTGPLADPAAGSGIDPNATVAALQNTPVNKWSPQQYMAVKAANPNFLSSAIQAAGLDESSVDASMKALLPQWSTTRAGSSGQVQAGGSISNAQSGGG